MHPIFQPDTEAIDRIRVVQAGLERQHIADLQGPVRLRLPFEARVFVQLEAYTVPEAVDIALERSGLAERGSSSRER